MDNQPQIMDVGPEKSNLCGLEPQLIKLEFIIYLHIFYIVTKSFTVLGNNDECSEERLAWTGTAELAVLNLITVSSIQL